MIKRKVPRKLVPLYTAAKRTITLVGGRGGGKTQGIAECLTSRILCDSRRDGFYILARENLKNLVTSSREEILAAVDSMGVNKYFKEYPSRGEIKCLVNGNKFVFCGLRNEKDATHIKSFKNIYVFWADEATNIKKEVMELVTPSVRGADDSQIIISFNPARRSDYMYQRYVLNYDPELEMLIKVNYEDNPFFPSVLEKERQLCKRVSPTSYLRIWRGIPGNADDIILDPTWFKYYSVLPRLQFRIMTVDTAQKDKEHNDYTVAQIWGLGEDNRAYLVDQLRIKVKAIELRRRIPAFWAKHHQMDDPIYARKDTAVYGVLRIAYIEDAVSGTALIQEFQTVFRIPVEGIIRAKDKYMRALDAQPYFESGYVVLNANASYLSDFLLECEGFNATGDYNHDDQVDPAVDGVTKLLVEPKPFWELIT